MSIKQVNLTIQNVRAQALLKVRLENVYRIVDRALLTLDRNPNLLTVCLPPPLLLCLSLHSTLYISLPPLLLFADPFSPLSLGPCEICWWASLLCVQLHAGYRPSETRWLYWSHHRCVVSLSLWNSLSCTLHLVLHSQSHLLSKSLHLTLHSINLTHSIIERTLDQTGAILTQAVVGTVLDLPIISEVCAYPRFFSLCLRARCLYPCVCVLGLGCVYCVCNWSLISVCCVSVSVCLSICVSVYVS